MLIFRGVDIFGGFLEIIRPDYLRFSPPCRVHELANEPARTITLQRGQREERATQNSLVRQVYRHDIQERILWMCMCMSKNHLNSFDCFWGLEYPPKTDDLKW